MKKVLRGILKWFGRVLLALLTLIVLAILVLILFKGRILERGVEFANTKQPGVVSLGELNLRPFRHFPDLTLQLNDINYFMGDSASAIYDTLPVFNMDKIFVSLNIVELFKGSYEISKIELERGEINYTIYGDSVSNLELALGQLFGTETDTTEEIKDSSSIRLNLEDLTISNVKLNYIDVPGSINVSLWLNQLKSSFSYFPEMLAAKVDIDLDIKRAEYGEIILDKQEKFLFCSDVKYDPALEKVTLEQGNLKLKGALIDLSGTVMLAQDNFMDLNFSFKNSGIELLNFVLMGVLDMDAIEQIGNGNIEIGGEVYGSLGDQLPELKINFRANDLGFTIKDLDQSVTDINFEGTASNGKLADFSQASLSMNHFHAAFPDGMIDISLTASNLLKPSVNLSVNGYADLSLMNKIIDTESIKNLEGNIEFSGDFNGVIDKSKGKFPEDAGMLSAKLKNVRFSLPDNKVERLDGEIYLEGRNAGLRKMDITMDENSFSLDLDLNNVFPYFLGFKADPAIKLVFRSEVIYPGNFISDTSANILFGEAVRDLGFSVSMKMDYNQFKAAIEESALPTNMEVKIKDLQVNLPRYTEISKLGCSIKIDGDNIDLKDFKGNIGTSSFNFDALVKNYTAYLEKDSAAPISIAFQLASRSMKAREMLTFNSQFMGLPETYIDEEMKNFLFKGTIETSVGELLKESGLPDFKFKTDNIHWDFRYYPLSFRDFKIDVENKKNVITVNTFKGSIGKSNIILKASIANLLDSTGIISGYLDIQSDLLDFNELLNYNFKEVADTLAVAETGADEESSSFDLIKIDFPDFQLNVDIGELRYEENDFFSLQGQIRSIPEKIIYLDKFMVQAKTGGTVVLDGQLNLINPEAYTLSASFDIDTLNVSDFDVSFSMNDSVYRLDQTFTGTIDAVGIAEVFILPDLNVDLENTTASFNVSLKDGRVMNFTPLQAAARFTGNKDLNDVKFGEIRNRFTLVNKTIYIPLMSINSTLGQLGVEGEQGMDGHYMYLVRVPAWLIRGTAKNIISGQKGKKEEETISETKSGTFASITVSDKGVKLGDRRESFDDPEPPK